MIPWKSSAYLSMGFILLGCDVNAINGFGGCQLKVKITEINWIAKIFRSTWYSQFNHFIMLRMWNYFTSGWKIFQLKIHLHLMDNCIEICCRLKSSSFGIRYTIICFSTLFPALRFSTFSHEKNPIEVSKEVKCLSL